MDPKAKAQLVELQIELHGFEGYKPLERYRGQHMTMYYLQRYRVAKRFFQKEFNKRYGRSNR